MNSVLITGGTGYFGRAMVQELMSQGTVRICVYSRDEAKQAAMRAEIHDPYQHIHWFVGDVRDLRRLTRAMAGVEVIIHAAALKRVEVGEYNPDEMVKTNVIGTMNVIQAAIDAKIDEISLPRHVVALSSDKACEPLNAYGASKLMMEKLILGANNNRGRYGPTFSVTRYGNVAGSTGSVIPTWREQIRAQRPMTMTDPEATRFWMTRQESVDLVMDVAKNCRGGKLHVPNLPAYRLHDLQIAIAREAGHKTMVSGITGLRPGEKMHERMIEGGMTSANAERLTVDSLVERLKSV